MALVSLLLLILCFSIIPIIGKKSITLTHKRIIVRKRLSKKVKCIRVKDVLDVNLHQSPIGSFFDCGDIFIEHKQPGCTVVIKGVNNPSLMVSNIEYLYELSSA